MEEKKKEISMGKPEKLSYEKLESLAKQMSNQITELSYKLRQAEMTIQSVNRLNYLLEIVKVPGVFSNKFINNCAKEIEVMMAISEEETPDKETSKTDK